MPHAMKAMGFAGGAKIAPLLDPSYDQLNCKRLVRSKANESEGDGDG
jgi:hypothetical protein